MFSAVWGTDQYRVGQGVIENINTFQHTVGSTPVAVIRHVLFSMKDTHKRG